MRVSNDYRAVYTKFAKNALNLIKNDGRAARAVSAHMSRGDIVSGNDEQSLMKSDPMLYLSAKMSQQMFVRHRDISDRSIVDKYSTRCGSEREHRREEAWSVTRVPAVESDYDEEEELEKAGVTVGLQVDVKA